eukprot:RCo011629
MGCRFAALCLCSSSGPACALVFWSCLLDGQWQQFLSSFLRSAPFFPLFGETRELSKGAECLFSAVLRRTGAFRRVTSPSVARGASFVVSCVTIFGALIHRAIVL